jgi:vacuolar-type H+-ATPase subunit H
MAVFNLQPTRPRRKTTHDSINVPPRARMAGAVAKSEREASYVDNFIRKNPKPPLVEGGKTNAEKRAVLSEHNKTKDLFQERFVDLCGDVYLGLTRAQKALPEQGENFQNLIEATKALRWSVPTRQYLNGNIKRLQDIRDTLDHIDTQYTPRDTHSKLAWLMCGLNEISLAIFADRITTNDTAMQRMFDARIQKLVPDMENRFSEAERRASERAERAEEEVSVHSEELVNKTLKVVRAYATQIEDLQEKTDDLILTTKSNTDFLSDRIFQLEVQNDQRTARKNRSWSKRFNPLGADANAADALPDLLAQLRVPE